MDIMRDIMLLLDTWLDINTEIYEHSGSKFENVA